MNSASQWAVGLMTGTVLDGNIDVALLRTDGQTIEACGPYTLARYQDATVELLHQCQHQALQWQFDGPEPALFRQAEDRLTREQAAAISQLLEAHDMVPDEIRVVGFHGQTVLHRPPLPERIGMTRQLGDGALMAQLLGIDVVDDFRSADMRAGGQGAPLSAIYHSALLEQTDTSGTSAVLNLGGVANLTWSNGADILVAFDTGPANAPLNDFVRQSGYADYDVDGRLAAAGTVDERRLAALLKHPYMSAAYPKSLDRFDFSWRMAEGYDLEAGAALLTAFSAAAVGCALDLLPQRPEKLIVCGGGRHNPTLMRELCKRTAASVVPAEAVGWRGDAMEAECFAYLAMRKLKSWPSSFPGTTGVLSPVCAGNIHTANTR